MTITKKFTVKELAEKLGASIKGDASLVITDLNSLEEAGATSITFTNDKSLKNASYALENTRAAAIIVAEELKDSLTSVSKTLLFVKNVSSILPKIIPFFHTQFRPNPGISDKADIHPTVKIGKDVFVGAFSSIGENTVIGDNCVIFPHVTIYHNVTLHQNVIIHSAAVIRENCELDDNVIIQNGTIIGGDGFGYVPDPEIGLRAVPQVGSVKLNKFVEIGTNSCVDRAALGTTDIGMGTKIDNLVQIGHNVKIGNYSIICGTAAIGGSTVIGEQTILGGGVGVSDHLKLAAGVRVAAGSGVTTNLESKGDYGGYPAVPIMQWRRQQVILGAAKRKKKIEK